MLAIAQRAVQNGDGQGLEQEVTDMPLRAFTHAAQIETTRASPSQSKRPTSSRANESQLLERSLERSTFGLQILQGKRVPTATEPAGPNLRSVNTKEVESPRQNTAVPMNQDNVVERSPAIPDESLGTDKGISNAHS